MAAFQNPEFYRVAMGLRPTHRNESHKRRRPRASGDPRPVDSRFRGNDVTFERAAWELFPEIADQTLDDDGQPSCSAAAALERREPFINSTLAEHALALLARLFRYGETSYHGGFINLATGAT